MDRHADRLTPPPTRAADKPSTARIRPNESRKDQKTRRQSVIWELNTALGDTRWEVPEFRT
jgi:hypothetical protein